MRAKVTYQAQLWRWRWNVYNDSGILLNWGFAMTPDEAGDRARRWMNLFALRKQSW